MSAGANPYATCRLEALEWIGFDATPAELLSRWQRMGRRGALVAPEGHGKSTLLRALASLLEERGERVERMTCSAAASRFGSADWRRLARAAECGAVVAFDGLERLRPPQRWRLRRELRGSGGLLCTRHRPGWPPTLYRPRTGLPLLRELVARLDPRAAPRLEPELQGLLLKHRHDVRACLLELFDNWRPQPAAGGPPARNQVRVVQG